jgi:SAM-dependent methyltransferase
MNASDDSFRVEKEIGAFTKVLQEGGVTSSIPPIFTYWASRYLSPRLREVFGDAGINEIFAKELIEAYARVRDRAASVTAPFRVLSLGSGDCTAEVEIVKLLIGLGCTRLEFVCTDLNPEVSRFAEDLAAREGVAQHMRFTVLDLNQSFPDGRFDAVMANHALHHFVGLEFLFDSVHRCLADQGSFVISDMIGRNGHMRWPEALVFVEQLWDFLPIDKKFNFFAKCHEATYVNYDCTSDGTYEGVRAQDIFPLLFGRFSFRKFVGHGNVIDVFVDRIYGRNFSPDDPSDLRFIDYVERLNTSLIDAGVVRPTAMFATLTKDPGECRYSRWAPASCLQRT